MLNAVNKGGISAYIISDRRIIWIIIFSSRLKVSRINSMSCAPFALFRLTFESPPRMTGIKWCSFFRTISKILAFELYVTKFNSKMYSSKRKDVRGVMCAITNKTFISFIVVLIARILQRHYVR